MASDSPNASEVPHPTGSNKRKPKTVRRVVEAESIEISNGLEDKYVDQTEMQQAFLNQVPDLILRFEI